jgi:hypothetical protein
MANVKVIVKANGCLDSVLQQNGTQIKTIPSAATFDLITKLDGVVEDGTWDGVDTLDFTSAACSPVTFQINAVNKESITSGTTFNLITKLDGAVNSGSYDAPTDTLSFTSAPSASLAVTVSDTTPTVGETITITATPTGLTPTNHIFFRFDGTTITILAEQASGVYNWPVMVATGSYTLYVLATDGTTDVYSEVAITVSNSAYNATTQAFMLALQLFPINATVNVHGITNTALWNAVEAFVLDGVANSWLAKIVTAYMGVGGTSSTNKWNLVNPLDTDLAYRAEFFGGVTFNSNGLTGNAVNGYVKTNVVPSEVLAIGTTGVTFYQRNAVVTASAGDKYFFGTSARFTTDFLGMSGFGTQTMYGGVNDATALLSSSLGNFTGVFSINRTATNSLKAFKNGVQFYSSALGTSLRSFVDLNILRGDFPTVGGSAQGYVDANIPTFIVHQGMSDADVTSISTAIATFNTALGR